MIQTKRTYAPLPLTVVLLRTFTVGHALRRWQNALTAQSRVARVVGQARANTIVVQWFAQCILATGAEQCARILALHGDARLLEATIGIVATPIDTSIVLANIAQRTRLVLFTVIVGNCGGMGKTHKQFSSKRSP